MLTLLPQHLSGHSGQSSLDQSVPQLLEGLFPSGHGPSEGVQHVEPRLVDVVPVVGEVGLDVVLSEAQMVTQFPDAQPRAEVFGDVQLIQECQGPLERD